jgi:hypothetical protein
MSELVPLFLEPNYFNCMEVRHFKHILKCDLLQNTGTKSFENGSTDAWPHLRLDFLKPSKIRDAQRRSPTDPEYNPKTLYVPEEFKKNLTPVSD